MNIQKLIDQTRDIYDNHEHTTTVMNALDYLESLVKQEEVKRVEKSSKKGLEIKFIKAVKDDFTDHIGPSKTTSIFLSIDGTLFDLGKFYEGPYMSEGTDKRLGKLLAFEEICSRLFNA
ncbi:MAG: hypothetical protein GY750_09910 [Lentisphaerae bacterium]|nr:hypothetical protein [Lentisphaerota bacterium]